MALNSNISILFSSPSLYAEKSDFGGPFFERFVHLYLAFVTIHKIYFEFLCKNFLPSHYCIPHFFENWVKVFSVLFFCTNEWSWFCCYCQGICRRWSAIYFPLYYIAGEKAIFTTVFLTFFKPFTIWRKNRVLGGVFWKVCAPLPRFCYYAQNILRVFVQEFFCPLSYFIPPFFEKLPK